MNGHQAVRFIDRLLEQTQQRKLNDLESKIVLQTWTGHTYRSIADRLSYDLDYIKQIAARLWKSLSNLLGENICKSNIKSVLERSQEAIPLTQPPPWSTANWQESSDCNKIDLPTIETWMISDRLTTISFLCSEETSQVSRSHKLDPEVQNKIESLLYQNSCQPLAPNVFINELMSVLTVRNPDKTAVNCLIVNCYF